MAERGADPACENRGHCAPFEADGQMPNGVHADVQPNQI
jgi:hypothetical protein